MNDEQLQQAFLQFLMQKSGAKNERELQAYVQKLGDEGLQQAYQEFTQLMQQQTQKAQKGAKLMYIKKLKNQCAEDEELQYYKRGGKVDCGCVKKAQAGTKVETKKVNSAVEEFKKRKKDKNLTKGYNTPEAREKQRKNREQAAKGEGESPVTDKNFNKGIGKNEKGGKTPKACGGTKFIKKGQITIG